MPCRPRSFSSRLPAILLALLSTAAVAEVDEHIVLPPLHAGRGLPTRMLVFIPGGKVPNEKYVATAMSIQECAKHLELWVVIVAVFQRLCIISCPSPSLCDPLHTNVEEALLAAQDQGWRRGEDEEELWLAGHSLGGVCANTLFQAYSRPQLSYAGMVVMGSYVDEAGDHDVANYPKPVLTLNAELDVGMARPGKTAIWWRQHIALNASRGEAYALANKPVVVLPKMNHSDFCPGFDVPGDLAAEVPQREATAEIGGVVGAFLEAQLGIQDALDMLRGKAAWTSELLSGYLRAQDMERVASDTRMGAEGASPFCAQAQHIIAGLSAEDDARLAVADEFHGEATGLVHCHPNWTFRAQDGSVFVKTCGHTDYYPDIANTGEITAAKEIACKMLSSERLTQEMKITAARPQADCRDINRHAVEVARSLAAPSTLERHARQGRGWCFLEDEPVPGNIGPLWVFDAELKLLSNSSCLAVASPSLNTQLDSKIYPGSHYCKVLSPARVLDWMMSDGLRRHDVAADAGFRPQAWGGLGEHATGHLEELWV